MRYFWFVFLFFIVAYLVPLAGRPLATRRICRTFGDCTTAPRNGMVSGCYPLDEFYKCRPECARVREVKRKLAGVK